MNSSKLRVVHTAKNTTANANTVIAQNVRALMKLRKLNQNSLAAATRGEVTQKTVSNVLAGLPSGVAVVECLATALGVPVWQLLLDAATPEARLVEGYTRADRAGRDLVEQIIERERLIRRQKHD
jgi:hypothetical protein